MEIVILSILVGILLGIVLTLAYIFYIDPKNN